MTVPADACSNMMVADLPGNGKGDVFLGKDMWTHGAFHPAVVVWLFGHYLLLPTNSTAFAVKLVVNITPVSDTIFTRHKHLL